jgi:hypothetical protein
MPALADMCEYGPCHIYHSRNTLEARRKQDATVVEQTEDADVDTIDQVKVDLFPIECAGIPVGWK